MRKLENYLDSEASFEEPTRRFDPRRNRNICDCAFISDEEVSVGIREVFVHRSIKPFRLITEAFCGVLHILSFIGVNPKPVQLTLHWAESGGLEK